MKKILFTLSLALATVFAQAQTANEIITVCKEAMGGAAWDKIEGLKYIATVEQGGMKIPLEIVAMRDGRTYTKFTFQGMQITQGAFDGTTVWSTNFMTQKAEKADDETTENTKRTCKDFPSALFCAEKSGYTASLEDEETVDGVVCYKIKLDKKAQLSEGKEIPNVEYYFIDKDSKAIIMTEEEITDGEMKGKIAQTKYSDYQEVNGVYVAFSQTMGIKDGESHAITFEKVEANPTVADATFKMPTE
jgi:outer membrane lipoprotein-sorting protein